MNLPAEWLDAIDNDEPIQVEGFEFYPIKMRDYRRFEAVKTVLLIRQGSLPVEYAVMNYLSALYAMDHDAATKSENGAPVGFISGIVTLLALAMRFPVQALLRQTQIEVSGDNTRELLALRMTAGDVMLRLTPALFDRIRPVLAAQNGLELPDEAENIDLVEAEMDIAAQTSADIKVDYRTLIASVARDQRCRQSELMDYTIREFMELKAAIDRDKMFTLCRQAEISGEVKFPKGNPYPSWCFDRKAQGSMISMQTFMAGPGSVAAQK